MTPEEFAVNFEHALDRPSVIDKLTNAISSKLTDQLTVTLSQEIQLLRVEIADRDKKIDTLEKEVKKLKPLSNEVNVLKKSLNSYKQLIDAQEVKINNLESRDDDKEQYMRRIL